MVCAHITDAPAWAGVVLPAQQGGAQRPEFRPRDADVHILDADEAALAGYSDERVVLCQPSSIFRQPGVFLQWRGSVVAA